MGNAQNRFPETLIASQGLEWVARFNHTIASVVWWGWFWRLLDDGTLKRAGFAWTAEAVTALIDEKFDAQLA